MLPFVSDVTDYIQHKSGAVILDCAASYLAPRPGLEPGTY